MTMIRNTRAEFAIPGYAPAVNGRFPRDHVASGTLTAATPSGADPNREEDDDLYDEDEDDDFSDEEDDELDDDEDDLEFDDQL